MRVQVTKGKFKKIRELNRRRNYFMKRLRYILRILLVKTLWDKSGLSNVDLSSAKKVLLMRNEGTLGDAIVDSPLVKSLHDSGYIVDFLLSTSNRQIMQYNPNIRHIYETANLDSESFLKNITHNIPQETIKELANNQYDIVIDPSLFDMPAHRMLLLRQINPKSVIGFNKWPCIKRYSKSFDFDALNNHVSDANHMIADYLGLNKEHIDNYEIYIPDDVHTEVNEYVEKISGHKVVINIFASNQDRSLSQEQLLSIIARLQTDFPNIHIILLDHQNKITVPLPDKVTINPFRSLHHTMALISQADLVISPDTSIVHMAATWRRPLIAIYRDIPTNNRLWAPGYAQARQILIRSGKLHQQQDIDSLIMAELDPEWIATLKQD